MGKIRRNDSFLIGIQAAKALTGYLESRRDHGGNRPVFVSQHTGEALTVSGLRQILKRLARRAGVEEARIHPHLPPHL